MERKKSVYSTISIAITIVVVIYNIWNDIILYNDMRKEILEQCSQQDYLSITLISGSFSIAFITYIYLVVLLAIPLVLSFRRKEKFRKLALWFLVFSFIIYIALPFIGISIVYST